MPDPIALSRRRMLDATAATAVLAGGVALGGTLAWAAPASVAAPIDPDGPLFAVLDAVGPLTADAFHPGRAIAAMAALLALPPEPRVAALRRYVAVRPDPPQGLFAVVRTLVEPPARERTASPWPGVLEPGYLRPPALGAPSPPQPADLEQVPHWPAILLDDVPLVEVEGYALGGEAEPLRMHLDGLAGATWRTAPLAAGSAGSVRYLLVHWGRWAQVPNVLARFEEQLGRYEGG